MDVKIKRIKSEEEFEKWFEKNFTKLGYDKVIKKNKKRFPDYIMLKGDRKIKVELETLSSNFILHHHDKKKVDIVICIKKDVELGIPIKEIKELRYKSGIERISATVDKETINKIICFSKKKKDTETNLILLKKQLNHSLKEIKNERR